MIDPRQIYKWKKTQSQVQKQMEQIFATSESKGIKVVARGDKHIERIEIDGEEQKLLKDIINDAMKEATKKSEKQLRGQLQDLGIPGL